MPFGCLPNRSKKPVKMMHAWDLVLKFYEMKVNFQDREFSSELTISVNLIFRSGGEERVAYWEKWKGIQLYKI